MPSTSSKPLTHGELFAGISGFGLGFAKAGIVTKWHVEIDPRCQDVLRRHYPGTPVLSDIRECGAHNLEPVDIISFGSPCQDLSVAGKRKGLGGERSGLYFEAIRIIRELHPAITVWENVPGALSSNGGRDFGAALDALAQSGAMDIGWAILDAQWFGLAQRRSRVFVVADFRARRAAEILAIPYGSAGDSAPSREKGQGITGTLDAKSASAHRGSQVNELEFITPVIAFAQNEREEVRDLKDCAGAIAAEPGIHQQMYVANWASGGGRMDDDKAASIRAEAEKSYQFVWHNKQQSGEVRVQDETVNSITKQWGTGGNNVPFVGVRRLMPVECERLQGFPDGWTEGQSDSTRYRQLGNAVAVPCAEWIGWRISNL